MDRARDIAVLHNDTGSHLSCLRMLGTYELFSGDNKTGIRTLETFVSMATANDPSAVAEGESHLGCGEMFIGRLESARRRHERLLAQGQQDLDDATSLRFFYNNSISVLNRVVAGAVANGISRGRGANGGDGRRVRA